MSEENQNAAEDIFSRPSEFRQSAVLAVWERAKPVKGKPDHRYDWRNGIVVGPWKPGENRDGIWDMGHKEAWYKVVERLKKVEGITREQVLDEFNDLDNLGVEDPETNRGLGVNSRIRGEGRLSYGHEEEVLFDRTHAAEKEPLRQQFRAQIDEQQEKVEQRIRQYGSKGMNDKKEQAPERVIVWDTETTGLSPKRGDRIVEIGAIEMVDGKPTGEQFHVYINPERHIPKQATDVHGITDEDVKDAPKFADIAQDFLDFVGDAPLVAHNASFDMRFINAELEGAGHAPIGNDRKIDTLRIARQVLPELENYSLDTLADHFGVDRSGRDDFHGGLVDTLILGEVYQHLAGLAVEQGVQLIAGEEKARLAPDAEERRFEQAVRDEVALHPQWQRAKGFADRLREEEDRSQGGGIGY